jgi:hypothetical protein
MATSQLRSVQFRAQFNSQTRGGRYQHIPTYRQRGDTRLTCTTLSAGLGVEPDWGRRLPTGPPVYLYFAISLA